MAEMTREQIEELRGLLAKATPGPWHYAEREGRFLFKIMSASVYVAETSWHDASPIYPTKVGSEANFALIAAMRNALPALLDIAETAIRSLETKTREANARNLTRQERDDIEAVLLASSQPLYTVSKGGDANVAGISRNATSPGVTAGASETQESLQVIGECFGAHGGERRTDAMRRLLTEATARATAAEAEVARLRAALHKIADAQQVPARTDRDFGFNDARLSAALIARTALEGKSDE